MTNKGKALGIDYGDRRIGIAVSDDSRRVVFPRDYISNTSKAEVIQNIKTLCEQDQITLIVVGLPLNMEGEDSPQTIKVRKFAEGLGGAVDQEIVLHDERLTTRQSDTILTNIGMKTPAKREEKDSVSAAIILQNYLDI
jgi:putative pre-16S rRNA nuclease